MKKFLLYILMFLLVNGSIYSQSIKGRIVDTSQAPIPFATIALLNAQDSTVLNGNLSDEKGNFLIENITKGFYILKITAFGFNDRYSYKINIDSIHTINLSQIVLQSLLINLTEVSVTAIKKTIEFKNGNIIINVENSPLAKGNTLYDLLMKLPGVSIDDKAISLNGSPGVILMLDGRPQQLSHTQVLNLLRSMNAESVEKIELLKNPPVKYDASGTAGMINIKTKRVKLKGISGTTYASISQGFYARGNGGVSLNYLSNKVAVISSIDYNNNSYQNLSTFNRQFKSDTSLSVMSTYNSIKDIEIGINYKIGLDWFLNKKNIIGFKIDGGPGSYISNNTGITNLYYDNYLGFDQLNATISNPDKWDINNYNLNAQHLFDTLGTSIIFTSDYTRLTEKMSSDIKNYFLGANQSEVLPANIYRNNNLNATDIFATKVDFTKTIDSISSFETGAKFGSVNTSNNYLFERQNNLTSTYIKDSLLSNNYTYQEQTYAAYFNYNRTIKNINLVMGLRAENTNLIGNNTAKNFEIKRNYYNLFPNITMEYSPSNKNHFQINLNRRIERPDYSDLNPFRVYIDQYQSVVGNPFLLPHYSNQIEAAHTYKGILTNSFTFTKIDRVILGYTRQEDSSKTFEQTIKNMKFNNRYAYLLFFENDLKKWWNFNTTVNVTYIIYEGDVDGVPFRTASLFYSPSLTNTFALAKKIKLEILGFYRSGINNGLVQVKPRWMTSFAIKKTFLKDKLDVSIGINDIFYSSYFRTGAQFNNQDWNFKTTQDSRRFVVSLNYNFGKLKIEEREVNSSEEEKGRLGH